MKGRNSFIMILSFFIFLSLVVCLVDYFYRHHVTGLVTDSQGNPVQNVLVSRSLEGSGPNRWDDVQQITDNQGRFEFLYEDPTSSKPKDKITWILTFEHPEFQTKKVRIDLFWVKKKHDALSYGYVKKDIIVQLNQ